jgi:hypothetical protein
MVLLMNPNNGKRYGVNFEANGRGHRGVARGMISAIGE